jgi:hypothetical protein
MSALSLAVVFTVSSCVSGTFSDYMWHYVSVSVSDCGFGYFFGNISSRVSRCVTDSVSGRVSDCVSDGVSGSVFSGADTS